MQSWKTTARESLLRLGDYVTVENHRVELPDGRIISEWPWLVMPEYANVVAQWREAPDDALVVIRLRPERIHSYQG